MKKGPERGLFSCFIQVNEQVLRNEGKVIRNGVVALCLLQIFFLNAFARRVPFDYGFIENELKINVANYVEIKELSNTPAEYRVWGVWNYHHPVSEVAAVALDFDRYTRIFQYVFRCDRITEPKNRVCALGTWYVEGRAAVTRVWAIGNIDTLCWTDSSHLRFIASQNEDRFLEAKWSHLERGWLNYRTNGIRLAAFLVAAGRDSCRIGIMVQGWGTQSIPQWLVRMATNIILPHLLQNIESEVVRREEERKPREMPKEWYSKWYEALRQFFFSN
jgi:hypothetical protein